MNNIGKQLDATITAY